MELIEDVVVGRLAGAGIDDLESIFVGAGEGLGIAARIEDEDEVFDGGEPLNEGLAGLLEGIGIEIPGED